MPRLSVKQKKSAPRSKSGAKAGRGRTPVLDAETHNYAKLLADPCNGPLTAPQYGASSGGYLARLSKSIQVDLSAGVGGGSNGYIIWFPDYTGGDTTANNGSCFLYRNVNADAVPVNDNTNPLGSAYTPCGSFIEDPAYAFERSTAVSDMRTAAACMKMIYTGRNDQLAGRVAIATNISRQMVLSGLSVNKVFTLSPNHVRTSFDPIESKFKPGEGSEFYRDSTVEEQRCFSKGTSPTSKTVVGDPETGSGHGIAFAWTNLETTSSFAFDFVKVVEWRPDFDLGLVEPNRTVAVSGGNAVSRALAWLDRHYPGWQSMLIRTGKSYASQLALTAARGPANAVLRAAPMIMM